MKKTTMLSLLVVGVFAQAQTVSATGLDKVAEETNIEAANPLVTVATGVVNAIIPATTTTTTLTTTTTTVKKTANANGPFTSPILNDIVHGQGNASNLPYYYGYRWNRSIHPVIDDWTEFLYKEIDANAPGLLEKTPKDATKFCPNYEKLSREERVLFWTRMMSVLMAFESEYRPEKTYDDTKNVKSAKGKIISRGLLMMSHESVMPAYYDCNMISSDQTQGDKDLHDPKKNMACAVRMINHWVTYDGVIADRSENAKGEVVWKGLPRYWGPFRHLMLKQDPESLWATLARRVPLWQAESTARDEYLTGTVSDAVEKGGPIDKKVWEANGSKTPHPSLMEEKYKSDPNLKESHRFSSIVRLMNQTAMCYR